MTELPGRPNAAIGCQYCGGPLGDSPSDDFCSDEHQQAWHDQRGVALTDYAEPWDSWADDAPYGDQSFPCEVAADGPGAVPSLTIPPPAPGDLLLLATSQGMFIVQPGIWSAAASDGRPEGAALNDERRPPT